jgi:uncharacterized protein YkwD
MWTVRRRADALSVAIRGFRSLLPLALVAVLTALAVPAVASPAGSPSATEVAALDSGVLQQLNQIRVLHRLAPLRLSAPLYASAAQHTLEMGQKGYFEHESADGTLFWKRIAHWYGSNGFGYWSVGENLLWSSPDVDPTQAMQLWMNSPDHRANILNPRWREIGISAVHFASAAGVYDGRAVTIITTDFGVRR